MATFKGTATFIMPGATELVSTKQPKDHITKTIGELEVEMLPMRSETQTGATLPLFHMQVRYRQGTMDKAKWDAMKPSLGSRPPKVYDGVGRSIPSSNLSRLTNEPDGAVLADYIAPGRSPAARGGGGGTGDPDHYDLEVPVGSDREVKVPFEFTDLPMP